MNERISLKVKRSELYAEVFMDRELSYIIYKCLTETFEYESNGYVVTNIPPREFDLNEIMDAVDLGILIYNGEDKIL